jgi:hypothetical protein
MKAENGLASAMLGRSRVSGICPMARLLLPDAPLTLGAPASDTVVDEPIR